jgi:7-carboxy-7-deazaguanine synthase
VITRVKPLFSSAHLAALYSAHGATARARGTKITHVETCGAFDSDAEFVWVTVSPKWNKLPTARMLNAADELKLIITHPDEIQHWVDKIAEIAGADYLEEARSIWLHPEWSKQDDRDVLDSITKWVKGNAGNYRAGWQLHKLYKSDQLDQRVQSIAPLGGNPELGY